MTMIWLFKHAGDVVAVRVFVGGQECGKLLFPAQVFEWLRRELKEQVQFKSAHAIQEDK